MYKHAANSNNRSEKCRQFHNVRHPLVQSLCKERRFILSTYTTETDCAEDTNIVKNLLFQQADSLTIEGNPITPLIKKQMHKLVVSPASIS